MFSIPVIGALPNPGFFWGTVVVPAGGAFVAVVLIAALVGSALGVLREAARSAPDRRASQPAAAPPMIDHADRPEQRQAA